MLKERRNIAAPIDPLLGKEKPPLNPLLGKEGRRGGELGLK
jgi:hypothetical protein